MEVRDGEENVEAAPRFFTKGGVGFASYPLVQGFLDYNAHPQTNKPVRHEVTNELAANGGPSDSNMKTRGTRKRGSRESG